jgi:hypothetical protein
VQPLALRTWDRAWVWLLYSLMTMRQTMMASLEEGEDFDTWDLLDARRRMMIAFARPISARLCHEFVRSTTQHLSTWIGVDLPLEATFAWHSSRSRVFTES